MNKLIYLALILGCLALPLPAHSFNDGAQILTGVAYYEADDECAVQTEFTSFEGGGFLAGTEGLYINGVLWADTSGLPTEGYQPGDRIAWGTEALSIKWNYQFDVTLRADYCTDLKAGDVISYRGTGGMDLSSYQLPQNPILMGAYSFNENTDAFDYVDLNTTRISITNLLGTSLFFGGGEAPSTTNGGTGNGCSLNALAGGAGSLSAWLGLASLVGVMTWRRFRA